jgi:predicted secreted protein
MPSTGINRGGLAAIYKSTTKVTHCTNVSFSVDFETRDVTTKDSTTWKDFLSGMGEWTASGEFYLAEDAALGFSDLYEDMIARTAITFMYSSEVTGDDKYSGPAYITNMTRTSSIDSESETYSISLKGQSGLTKAAVQ